MTGAIVSKRARIGDARIDSVTENLENIVAETLDEVGPGWGPLYGTQVHLTFAGKVRDANIPGVSVELPWLLGDPLVSTLLDSIRTDVALHANSDGSGPAIAAWDLKTGSAVLGPSRVAEIRRKLGVGPEVPVIELHAIHGTFIKAIVRFGDHPDA